ncbi:MAG: hypothetical protein MUE53_04455 [Chitinophagales bacterium]|jgi:hypothetical protein|nr:hypothetical protein [Chitinophagales bacterium]
MKNLHFTEIFFLIVTGAIIYNIFSDKKSTKKSLYRGFEDDKLNLSMDWQNVYDSYNKSYQKIANE